MPGNSIFLPAVENRLSWTRCLFTLISRRTENYLAGSGDYVLLSAQITLSVSGCHAGDIVITNAWHDFNDLFVCVHAAASWVRRPGRAMIIRKEQIQSSLKSFYGPSLDELFGCAGYDPGALCRKKKKHSTKVNPQSGLSLEHIIQLAP